ncbi:MerR family transcriptional regulator [Streptomyces malaysiensis]|uniref:MerR family transcriptional regulator n=1 Tax=Streptomyces malaysiensis TaxID=92644 RepID=A0A7X5XCC0_STRMQ|nr:MerR family transcriptional regulator [Streptomyces malaysiensis]
MKEDYAALLDFLGRGDVADEIMGFVLMFAAQGNERPDLKVVLRALHARGAQNFASLGRPFVANSSVEIRGEALGFLYDCDSPEAGSIFLDRLLEETDPELIQFIIDGLVMWHYVAATPGLLSLSEDPAHPAEVRAAARDALANLAADTEL